jgi:hypothetical protein
MTIINESELAELSTLDQVLMWSIISINASNLDSRNNYISDNAAIRAESKDYISWSVTQDDNGRGKFVFSALLPLVNPHPLKDKQSIIERIWSYSPFDPDLQTEAGISGYGWQLTSVPVWIDTTERLLAHCAIIATTISKYARLTKRPKADWANIHTEYWANCQYSISDTPYGGEMIVTGYLSIDWNKYISGKSLIRCLNPYVGNANDVNCNFPNLMQLWNVGDVDIFLPIDDIQPLIPIVGIFMPPPETLIVGEDTAEGLIDSYASKPFLDEAVPDWYQQALDGYKQQSDNRNNTSNDVGSATPKLIESLTICKEQDPEIITFSVSLAEKVPIK